MTAAMVGGVPVSVDEIDAREAQLRASRVASSLPRPGTSEGRQLRRWLTQLLVTERVVAAEAAARGLSADDAPSEDDVLPDMAVRLEIGSVAASVLSEPLARALFVSVTAGVDVTDDEVASYAARNPSRFADSAGVAEHLRAAAGVGRSGCGWTPGAPRSSNSPRATSTPAIPASPTTPIGTDDRSHACNRHRRHQDRRRPGRHHGTLSHHAKLPTPDGDAEAVWAVVDSLITEALATAGGRVRGVGIACGRADRSAFGNRQPDQYH